MSGVAVVFGLCALSFAAGCVLTAVMLRRDPPPEPAPEPAPAPSPPRFEAGFPPEEYATRPIHRNPVMGVPVALPAPRPARPNLVLVPDPKPVAELPVRQDAVRRMHVVRPAPAPVEPAVAKVGAPAEEPEPTDPVGGTEPEPAGPVTAVAGPSGPAEADAEHAKTTEAKDTFEAARRGTNR